MVERYTITSDDKLEPSDKNLFVELERAAKAFLEERTRKDIPIFTAGTGISDKTWIEYYKDIDVLIITRDGSMWRKGERVE